MKCGSDSSPQTSYSPSFHLEQTRCESNAQNSYPTKIKCQKKKGNLKRCNKPNTNIFISTQ